ncbi:alpha-l-rhamnosidase [Colletotrichum truncatum]|uniref:Alpha-l-rhamnosidase n=1 Tax=Colletotrichum truncatum TaxID=5467 RepID=A0ACC3Z9V3_COLTU|nr:alpha-l-rhamnosidase [Colletotrichum truncatum]KAF6796039.1 alpha-l-rhamnosidase [Colletotrichum truncatum]
MARLEFGIPSAIPEPFSANYLFAKDEVPEFLIPQRVHSSTNVTSPEHLKSSSPGSYATLSNSSDGNSSIVLDYGVAVAGIPFLQIQGLEAPSSKAVIDVTVSEGYPGITKAEGDGPYPFSAGADTSRRVRFRVTGPGFYEAKCVQGSQRWLKLSLVTKSPCSVRVSLAGFLPTTSNIPVDKLPGYFQCSDDTLSELWGYGARTLQLNCVPARSIPSPWQVSEDMGVLIDSQRCNAYGWGHLWTDYNLEFDGMVLEGGLAWMVRVTPGMPGMLFQLNIGNGKTVIEQWYGYYNKPQTTLVPNLIASFEIPEPEIRENQWFRVRTSCIGDATISISINGTHVAKFKQGGLKLDGFASLTLEPGKTDFPFSAQGSVAIGAGQDQLCRFKNLIVLSPDQKVLYESSLNTPAVLADFGLKTNQFPFVFDGAKRDRYPWTADIIVGGRSAYYSTAGSEYVRGNIVASMLRFKGDEKGRGLLPGGVPPGRDFTRDLTDGFFNIETINYSLYLILVIYDYWMYTGDDALVKFCWNKLKGCLAFVAARVNNDGLVCAEGIEAADYDYYNGIRTDISTKLNALYVASLKASAHLASSLSDQEAAKTYESTAKDVAEAIRTHCFNEELGQYNITDSRREGFHQEMHAWLILQDICTAEQITSILDNFKSLVSPSTINEAPLSFSPDTPGPPPVISPIMSTAHIQAALQAGRPADGERVLRNVFEPMADKTSEHFTGTTWEFINPDGTPFKGDFCSYAQLFGAGPTSILSQYALGVEPITSGFKEFRIWPRFDVTGLRWAQGRVPTPVGEGIVVKWQVSESGWLLEAWAPAGLEGKVRVPEPVWARKKRVTVDGKDGESGVEVNFTKHVEVAVFF